MLEINRIETNQRMSRVVQCNGFTFLGGQTATARTPLGLPTFRATAI